MIETWTSSVPGNAEFPVLMAAADSLKKEFVEWMVNRGRSLATAHQYANLVFSMLQGCDIRDPKTFIQGLDRYSPSSYGQRRTARNQFCVYLGLPTDDFRIKKGMVTTSSARSRWLKAVDAFRPQVERLIALADELGIEPDLTNLVAQFERNYRVWAGKNPPMARVDEQNNLLTVDLFDVAPVVDVMPHETIVADDDEDDQETKDLLARLESLAEE